MLNHALTAKFRSKPRFLLFLCILALLTRAIWFFCYERHEDHHRLSIDSIQYHYVAEQIAAGNGISTQDGKPNFFRMPGYPVYLAGCYHLMGENREAMLWLQLVLASIIPLLVFMLAGALLPGYPVVARLAGLVAAIHPGLVNFAGLMSTESIFLIFFLAALVAFYRGMQPTTQGQGYGRLIQLFCAAGALLGVASLFRALGHYVIALMLLLIVLFFKTTIPKRLTALGSLLISWLCVVGPWLIRNYLLTGFVFFHTLPGQHFLRYNAAHNLMAIENIGYNEAKHKLFDERNALIAAQEKQLHRPLLEPEKDALAEKLAKKLILAHPWLSIKHVCREMAQTYFYPFFRFVFRPPAGVNFDATTPLATKIAAYRARITSYPIIVPFVALDIAMESWLILGTLLFVFFSLRMRSNVRLWLTLPPLMALLIAITSSTGEARLRLPVEPLSIIVASYGWLTLYQQRRNKRPCLPESETTAI